MSERGANSTGTNNPNWKGGRSVTSHGYVVVRMRGHASAQATGYIYEHRLVAEKMLGRPLNASEHVHHCNQDKSDNRPENLMVCQTNRVHRSLHRTTGAVKRGPMEENRTIACGCGCGQEFLMYDICGRPRRYVSGHNRREGTITERVVGLVAESPRTRSDLAPLCANGRAFTTMLSKLVKQGRLHCHGKEWVVEGPGPCEDCPVRTNQSITCACGCGGVLLKYDAWWRERRFICGHNH